MGDFGVGYHVNPQILGEDVLGAATFIDAIIHNVHGVPFRIKNAISVREEDAGILWQQADFRAPKKVVTVRSHRLAVACTTTFNNYDYSINWFFYQDGSIQFQIQLLGIIYTTMIAAGSKSGVWGTQVAPQVGAQFHQHFFTARIDSDFDGIANSVSTQDVQGLNADTNSASNPYGQGITLNVTLLRTAGEGRTNIAPLKGRTWVVTNPNKASPVTGKVFWIVQLF